MATENDRISQEPSRTRSAQIALGVLAVLLVLLLAWFFLLRGDDDDLDSQTAEPAPVTEEAPEPQEEEVEEPGRNGPIETFEVFAPKDPFDPLISASAEGASGDGDGAAGDGGTTADDGTTAADGTGTATGDGTGTTTTTTTSGSSGGGDGSEDVNGHRVRVIDVYREGGAGRAQVQVDGTVYTVDEGERFAENFRLMSTSGQCATMLYGDDEFTLCEGEEILK